MLKFMTKKTFTEAVEESKFVVQQITTTRYMVYMIRPLTIDGKIKYHMQGVTNPEAIDGTFRLTGGGYNKAHEALERIARYVDENAEDKDHGLHTCLELFYNNQSCFTSI